MEHDREMLKIIADVKVDIAIKPELKSTIGSFEEDDCVIPEEVIPCSHDPISIKFRGVKDIPAEAASNLQNGSGEAVLFGGDHRATTLVSAISFHCDQIVNANSIGAKSLKPILPKQSSPTRSIFPDCQSASHGSESRKSLPSSSDNYSAPKGRSRIEKSCVDFTSYITANHLQLGWRQARREFQKGQPSKSSLPVLKDPRRCDNLFVEASSSSDYQQKSVLYRHDEQQNSPRDESSIARDVKLGHSCVSEQNSNRRLSSLDSSLSVLRSGRDNLAFDMSVDHVCSNSHHPAPVLKKRSSNSNRSLSSKSSFPRLKDTQGGYDDYPDSTPSFKRSSNATALDPQITQRAQHPHSFIQTTAPVVRDPLKFQRVNQRHLFQNPVVYESPKSNAYKSRATQPANQRSSFQNPVYDHPKSNAYESRATQPEDRPYQTSRAAPIVRDPQMSKLGNRYLHLSVENAAPVAQELPAVRRRDVWVQDASHIAPLSCAASKSAIPRFQNSLPVPEPVVEIGKDSDSNKVLPDSSNPADGQVAVIRPFTLILPSDSSDSHQASGILPAASNVRAIPGAARSVLPRGGRPESSIDLMRKSRMGFLPKSLTDADFNDDEDYEEEEEDEEQEEEEEERDGAVVTTAVSTTSRSRMWMRYGIKPIGGTTFTSESGMQSESPRKDTLAAGKKAPARKLGAKSIAPIMANCARVLSRQNSLPRNDSEGQHFPSIPQNVPTTIFGSVSMPPLIRKSSHHCSKLEVCLLRRRFPRFVYYDEDLHEVGRPYVFQICRKFQNGNEAKSLRCVLDGFEFIRWKQGRLGLVWRCLNKAPHPSRCPVRVVTKMVDGVVTIVGFKGTVCHLHSKLLPNRYTFPLALRPRGWSLGPGIGARTRGLELAPRALLDSSYIFRPNNLNKRS